MYGDDIPVVSLPSLNVPAPPSPNWTLHLVFIFAFVLYSSTILILSSTGEPCSIIIGLYPLSISVKAQNRPAGPAPIIIGWYFELRLCFIVGSCFSSTFFMFGYRDSSFTLILTA